MKRDRVTLERLKQVLDYDPATGVFRWKYGEEKHLKSQAGKIAGTQTTSYVVIGIDGNYIGAHRLAWLYVHGKYPEGHVDHINGISTDNRIANLRDVTHAQNMKNMRLSRRSSSGVHGVDYHGASGKWRARVTQDRVQHYTLHDTKEEAIAGAKALREKFQGEFMRIEQEQQP